MKKIQIKILSIMLFALSSLYSQAALIYPEHNYKGTPVAVNIGDELSDTRAKLTGNNKSIRILRSCGVYIYQGTNYSGTFMYITSNIAEIKKSWKDDSKWRNEYLNNQYNVVGSVRCVEPNEIPQPKRWVPVDGRYIPTGHPKNACDTPSMIPAGSPLLIVKRAFIWENTDCWMCVHGPWAEVRIKIEGGDNFKLAGPIPYAHDKPFWACWPSDEWADDRQGVLYANYGILNWAGTKLQSARVIVEEGGFTLLSVKVEKNTKDEIFAMSNYGYVVLQNIDLPSPKPHPCAGDKYVSAFPVSDGYWDGPNGPYKNFPLMGTAHYPFDNLQEALKMTPSKGTLVFSAGKYPGPIVIGAGVYSKPIILKACGGAASIGDGPKRTPALRVGASPNCDCPG